MTEIKHLNPSVHDNEVAFKSDSRLIKFKRQNLA